MAPFKYIHDIQVVSITTGRFEDVAFKPETVYTITFSNIDDLSGDLRRILQAQGIPVVGMFVGGRKSTSRPLILELPGGAVEQLEETLQLAGLRELLEECGISILGAQPRSHSYFYFWNHSSRTSGANKWLAKIVFVYAISDLDAWLLNNRIWDSELKMPKRK
ncbi:hypothetical protein N7530_012712 [Penicillium desertorum]|uniref:Nudix hydrolase domain-containing protein n=1 Tax=Penicillium desertorum TaxID=1303715 RepID=A0A9X0BFP4_9EURO|nr:hypothetical protein N7530_012712 [Penicillium desertorum]